MEFSGLAVYFVVFQMQVIHDALRHYLLCISSVLLLFNLMIIDQAELANWTAALLASLQVMILILIKHFLALLATVVLGVLFPLNIKVKRIESWRINRCCLHLVKPAFLASFTLTFELFRFL